MLGKASLRAVWPGLDEEALELAAAAWPELEEEALPLVAASDGGAVAGRFIFKIWSMSDSDRLRAFSLNLFALAWLFFSVLMTFRRSSRMRCASKRK